MFLLTSGHYVATHLDGQKHGVSIQISVNLGYKFFRISRLWETAVTWILARVFAYLPSFFPQILDFILELETCWTVLIFILTYFKSHDTENQQQNLLLTCKAKAAVTSFSPNVLSFNWRLTSSALASLMPSLILFRIVSDPFFFIEFVTQVSAIICIASVSPLARTEGDCSDILSRILFT